MNKAVCFGEWQWCLLPAMEQEQIKKAYLPECIGGAEVNVAQALAQWNIRVKYCTALPDDQLENKLFIMLHKGLLMYP